MIKVREINDPNDLLPLAATWGELLEKTPGASFFQTLEWLVVYWKYYGHEQRLRVLVIEDEGRVTGILPLVVRSSQRRFAGVRVLTYPLDSWGSYFGPIGPDSEGTLAHGLAHVRATRRDWQVLELAWVDRLNRDQGQTERALAAAALPATAEPWQASALIELDAFGSWEAYWASRESRWRNNVRRSEKKLASQGRVSYQRYRTVPGKSTAPRWDLYDTCVALAQASWQAKSTSGTTLVHPEVREFLREAHGVAAQAGAVDLNLLLIDGRAVAFNYAYHYRGHVFGLRTGFDSAAASDGAGTVLQARMIADSFLRHDHTYDLGVGYLDCKRYWMTTIRPSFRYTHFPTFVPMAQLMKAKRQLARWWRNQPSGSVLGLPLSVAPQAK